MHCAYSERQNDSKDASILTKRPRSPSVYEDVTDMPQPQRRRLILDAVVIIRRQVPPQKDRAQELENSVTDVKIDIKVKVKKYRQDTHFSLSIVHERLKDVKEFIVNLEPGEEDFIVTRDFTSHVYGGSSQATVPTIAEGDFFLPVTLQLTCISELQKAWFRRLFIPESRLQPPCTRKGWCPWYDVWRWSLCTGMAWNPPCYCRNWPKTVDVCWAVQVDPCSIDVGRRMEPNKY